MATGLARKAFLGFIIGFVGNVVASEPPTHLYWGDTHVHTKYSSDAFLNGNFSIGPDEAYRFAKGQPVIHPYHHARVSLARPLDFLVVSDHAEAMGVVHGIYYATDYGALSLKSKLFRKLAGWRVRRVMDGGSGGQTFKEMQPPIQGPIIGDPVANPQNEKPAGLSILGDITDIEENVWSKIVDAAERHNDPGRFTTFIDWEWSSTPVGANLHRVVFTPDGGDAAKQYLPFSSFDSQYPTDLWAWLDETTEKTGSEFVAIPHNSNLSKGYMFAETTVKGDKITPDYARLRARYEPVVEITQTKGTSETWPSLSPQDAFADFEGYPHYLQANKGSSYEATKADFVRQALGTGMEIESRIGVNPFKFGFVGSTDIHTGLSTPDDDNFLGKMPYDSIPENKAAGGALPSNGWGISASGIAAVWAAENTREAIFAAFKRREVYSTTGPRIALRVFGGFGFDKGLVSKADFVTEAYRIGVPMGGDLIADPQGRPFTLAIQAVRDPQGANLDQIQVVKVWLDSAGSSQERVYPVVWSGERALQENGFPAPIENTVDLTTGHTENRVGASELLAVWVDPEFNPAQKALYYVRVLQIPTARHSLYDTIALGLRRTEIAGPATIQERAYSSPIWYTP
jgi:hypothetical protein